MAMQKNPVIFVVGATATGKSEWALQMAQKCRGVIFNCDSVQVYRELEIGTAKPSPEERALVPHFLLDYVEPMKEMTAGQYRRDFFEEIVKIPEGVPVFVVGGTGFYFQAIEKGMYPVAEVPAEIQEAVEKSLESPEGCEALYQELLQKDPEAGRKIHPADHYRIGRAIEMIRSQGKTITQIRREFSLRQSDFPYPLLKIGLHWEREVLRSRIKLRVRRMLERGLIQEVEALLKKDLLDWSPLASVGYREVIFYLEEHETKEWLEEEIAQSTQQLAKRQKTWFQRDPEIRWFDGASEYDKALSVVESFVLACQNQFKENL